MSLEVNPPPYKPPVNNSPAVPSNNQVNSTSSGAKSGSVGAPPFTAVNLTHSDGASSPKGVGINVPLLGGWGSSRKEEEEPVVESFTLRGEGPGLENDQVESPVSKQHPPSENELQSQMEDIEGRLKKLKNDQKELKANFALLKGKPNLSTRAKSSLQGLVGKQQKEPLSYDQLIDKREQFRKDYIALKSEWTEVQNKLAGVKAEKNSDPKVRKQLKEATKIEKKAVDFFGKVTSKKVSKTNEVIAELAKGRITENKPETEATPKKDFSKITESLDGITFPGEYGTQTIERFSIVRKEEELLSNSFIELNKKKETLENELAEKQTALQVKQESVNETIDQHLASHEQDHPPVEDNDPAYIKNLDNLKTQLEQLLQPEIDEISKQKQAIEIQIAQIDKEIARIGQKSTNLPTTYGMKESDWIGSNYFRDLVRTYGYDEAVNRYTAIPVNMRYQSWSSSENSVTPNESVAKPEIGFIRLGVISDLRNGFTNLGELKDLARMTDENRNQALDQKIGKLKVMMGKLNPTKEKDANKIASLKSAIAQFEAAKDPNYLNEIISGRRAALRDQFAHLVNEQVNIHGARSAEAFQMAHVALLDENKKKLDSTGWMHSELNEMQDMEEIFKEYNGQTITFADIFHVDENGGIHLPRPDGVSPDQTSMRLETNFFNISVGGGITSRLFKKRTHQPGVLERSMEKLGEKATDSQRASFDGLKTRMEKGESTHRTAEDLAFLLHDLKIPFSIGCLSAKDRTKLVGENVIRRFAIETTKNTKILKAKAFYLRGNMEEVNKGIAAKEAKYIKKLEADAKKSGEKILDDAWTNPSNASSQVLEDTTGNTAAKLSPHLVTHISLRAKFAFAMDGLMTHHIRPWRTGKKSEF